MNPSQERRWPKAGDADSGSNFIRHVIDSSHSPAPEVGCAAMKRQVLISGGPGAGCTSTAERIGSEFDLTVFDSDSYFHKPTDPPFQEQHTPEERRSLLSEALGRSSPWIVSGSIATWGLELQPVLFGIFLDTPAEVRLERLRLREHQRFGDRINVGGDLHEENKEFMQLAAGYDTRTGRDRNRSTDRDFRFMKKVGQPPQVK